MTITLPWPPRALSPNARGHWAAKAKAAVQYKRDCIWVCKAAHLTRFNTETAQLDIVFRPKTARRQDLDNMLASAKYALDAISYVIGIDDSKFSLKLSRGTPVKGGQVVVTIGGAA